MAIEKIKIMGAVLELPAKQHCQIKKVLTANFLKNLNICRNIGVWREVSIFCRTLLEEHCKVEIGKIFKKKTFKYVGVVNFNF